MDKKNLLAGAIFGLLGVILGAFAAHGLKPLIPEASMTSLETGIRYQMYHSLLLLFMGGTAMVPEKIKIICFWLLVVGILFFSGSIYLLATNSLTDFNFQGIWFITPLGGSLLIAAWLFLLFSFLKLKKK